MGMFGVAHSINTDIGRDDEPYIESDELAQRAQRHDIIRETVFYVRKSGLGYSDFEKMFKCGYATLPKTPWGVPTIEALQDVLDKIREYVEPTTTRTNRVPAAMQQNTVTA